MHWNVHDLCSEFVLWMFDQDARPGTTSLVGILSSLAFERLISPFVPRGIIMHLRPFIELTAFLYSSGGRSSYANRRPSDLWRLHAYLGSKVLQCLNKVLNNTSLEKSTLGELQAIFLVLFATLIAVGYSRRWNRVEVSPPDRGMRSMLICYKPILRPPSATVDYVATQTQLLRVLAHHLIFIGRQTKVLGLDLSESQIIEEASCQWKRRATFEWKEIPFTPSEPTNVNTATNQDDLETDQAATQCRYHISRSHPASADCKPVGGFGTCIKDADIDVFGRELSPMDYILAGHQLSTTGGWLEEVSIDALDLDFSNDCSTTETTIFTPQSTLEGTPQNSERFGCEESWSSVKVWHCNTLCQARSVLTFNKAQPDVPEFPGSTATKRHGMMKDDHHQSLAAATSTANPPTTRTDFPQNSDSSLTPKAYSVPPLSQGYDNLGGLAASLRSTNLIV